jgi:hypothetical protein
LKELKDEIKHKDAYLLNLKLKEGELKGKDEVLNALNRNFEKI